jgi:hypothetical protein
MLVVIWMTVNLCREYDQPGCCRSIAGDMAAKRADTLAMTSEAFLFLPCALVTTAIAVGFEPLSWSPRLAPALLSTSAGRFAWTIVFSSALLEAAGFSLGTMGQGDSP